jgi:hypothetical protein
MNSRQLATHSKRRRGHLSFEVPAVSILFLVFSFLSADMGYLLYGADFNDRACRDAARAAAQSSSLTEAMKKTTAVLQSHQGNAFVMSGPVLYGPVVYQDFGGSPPAQTSPFVTVTTTTTINLPFAPIRFDGATFGANGNMAFTQSYTYPIVRFK